MKLIDLVEYVPAMPTNLRQQGLTVPELERFVAGLSSSRARWEHLVRHGDDIRVYEQPIEAAAA